MPRSQTFFPPKPSKSAISVGRAVISPVLRLKYGVVEIEIGEEDVARLRRLRNERALIAPNHPSAAEPGIIFKLSHAVDEPFYYVSCREAFDHSRGLWGRCLQKLGAYSVVRGVADRESFRMTRSLLCKPATKIVLFPEGEVYSQNDTLLPFQSGVSQLMFWALEDIRKTEPSGSLHIVPIAIKYRYVRDMQPAILAALGRLEQALALPLDSSLEPYPRLRRIAAAVLGAMEDDYSLKRGPDDGDMNERIAAFKEALVQRVTSALCLPVREDERSLSQRMRALFNAVNQVTRDDLPIKSEYEARLHAMQRERILPHLKDLDRLANLIAIQDGYVGALPTPERMADTLRRLETEVLGRAYCTGPRRCRVRVGESFDLAEHLTEYASDKRAAVRAVTGRLEEAVQGLLNEMTQ